MELKQTLEQIARQTGARCDYLDSAGSTNDRARDARYDAGSVVLAERQTSSRGQRGNTWSSTEGLNLTFSIVLRPDFLPADQQFYLSKAVSLAVADTVTHFGAPSCIKWPNDIYIDNSKTCGILIENDLAGGMLARSIVGIGLNVNQTTFDESLPNPTSLALAAGHTVDRGECLGFLYQRMCLWYSILAEGGFEAIDRQYLERIYRMNEIHPFVDGHTGRRFRGTICGVRPTGELEIRTEEGALNNYLFKEVEYVIAEKSL